MCMVHTSFYRFFLSFLLPFNITLFLYFGGKRHIKCLLWSQGAWYLQYRAFKTNKLHWKKKVLILHPFMLSWSFSQCYSPFSSPSFLPLRRFLWPSLLPCSLPYPPLLLLLSSLNICVCDRRKNGDSPPTLLPSPFSSHFFPSFFLWLALLFTWSQSLTFHSPTVRLLHLYFILSTSFCPPIPNPHPHPPFPQGFHL